MSAAASPAAADEAMDTDLPAAPEATLNKKARQALLTDFEIWQVKTSKGDLDLLEVSGTNDEHGDNSQIRHFYNFVRCNRTQTTERPRCAFV